MRRRPPPPCTSTPQRLARDASSARRLIPELGGGDAEAEVKAEQTYGNTRVDFAVHHHGGGGGGGGGGGVTLVEVKSAVGADFPAGCTADALAGARAKATLGPVYCSEREPYVRSAIFPHGTKWKPKIRVISERAIKQARAPPPLRVTCSRRGVEAARPAANTVAYAPCR